MRFPRIGRKRDGGAAGARELEVPLLVPTLVDSDGMDEHFRRVCAVFSDGRCVIAQGYELDPQLRTSLQRLKREGVIPDRLMQEKASLEEVAGLWEAVQAQVDGEGDSQLALRLKRVVETAAAARASDLVLEVEGGACRVSVIANDRKRPLGERLTEAQGRELAGFLFHNKEEGTGQTSYQRQSFQGFSVRHGDGVVFPHGVSGLRCQRGPHEPEGDHVVARIFYRDQLAEGTTLRSLGFSAGDEAMFAELRSSMSGGIILGGSTGDGKSTTLAVNLTLQQREHGGELNLVTVEDPVEYELPGAIQIAVPTTGAGEERGENFTRALMHFVRVHPAVGMVSEIRDGHAAREVLQFIATGHQVWTTIHVADANGILFRLLDMGVRASEICRPDLIKLLMKQTLLSLLCEGCRVEEVPDGIPAWLCERLQGFDRVRYRNPEGCEKCRREEDNEIAAAVWRGYGGRTAVCETIRPDPDYLGFVKAEDAAGARDYWIGTLGGVWSLAGAVVLALLTLNWTGRGRVLADRVAPFSLYRTITGSAFLFVVIEFLGAGVDLNDRTFARLKAASSRYTRSRIEAIETRMRAGLGMGRAMVECGQGFPDPSLVGVVAALETNKGWEEKLAGFVGRWSTRARRLLKQRTALVSGLLMAVAALLVAIAVLGMFGMMKAADTGFV